jgi:hypothetical protein
VGGCFSVSVSTTAGKIFIFVANRKILLSHSHLHLGEEETPELSLLLDVIQHLDLLRTSQTDNGSSKEVELDSETDPETPEPDSREETVGHEELLRVVLHVSELQNPRLDEGSEGSRTLRGVGRPRDVLDLLEEIGRPAVVVEGARARSCRGCTQLPA